MLLNRIVLGLATLVLTTVDWAPVAFAGGVVTTCDETNLANALTGGGLVRFNCGAAPVTIDITSPKVVSIDTIVDGGGLVTIRSNGSADVFQVTGSADFSARNLTLSNADAGIDTSGTGRIFAANCTFSGSYYGIDNRGSGPVTVTNCNFSNGRYGINNLGTGPLTATDCNFSGNTDYGIDHRSTGSVTATGCTFMGTGLDYGIDNEETGSVTATNCTFNGSEYGIDNEKTGPVTATNCTFSANDYGIVNESTAAFTVTNCILADSDTTNCSGTITDGGHNLDTGMTCGFGGSSLSDVVAGLDPAGLADNGGPTQTIALLSSSAAINAGDESVCAAAPVHSVDQRGFVRPGIGATNCSIGAFEFNARPPSQAPALSPLGLVTLAALLSGIGALALRRRESTRTHRLH